MNRSSCRGSEVGIPGQVRGLAWLSHQGAQGRKEGRNEVEAATRLKGHQGVWASHKHREHSSKDIPEIEVRFGAHDRIKRGEMKGKERRHEVVAKEAARAWVTSSGSE